MFLPRQIGSGEGARARVNVLKQQQTTPAEPLTIISSTLIQVPNTVARKKRYTVSIVPSHSLTRFAILGIHYQVEVQAVRAPLILPAFHQTAITMPLLTCE